ncbi:Scavenger receptor class B [Nesidiocoris tenuis]|uniref:Scavenger receptor class B n=1 Tax=Nesidiocoris tenuis TaxID=355587 RepID=A0ABN7AT72_9HEMI|nr:Scavenger receptor class B [Nesidiocoris tenuis]
MRNWFRDRRGDPSRGIYAPVRTSEKVYEDTTEPTPESLSPTETVFTKFLGGRLSSDRGANKRWVLTTMLCGLFAITLGSVIVAVDPYQMIFKMKVVLSDGAETFMIWKKPDVDLLLKVRLFNVTNAEEFLSGRDKKIKVVEVGPYVYRERMEHANISFNENGTISADPLHPLQFAPELSAGKEDDLLILPNIALLSFAEVKSSSSYFTRVAVNLLFHQTGSKPLVEMTAKEFMFGYKSTLLSLGNKFMPSWISFDKLGLIDRMYDFNGDTSTTYTGIDDLRKAGLLATYNRQTVLPQWEAPCNNLSLASDGTKFPALIRKDQELLFFRKSLCRSMNLVKIGEEVVDGIHGYRYTFKNNSLDNGEFDPVNKCFCNKHCLPRGFLDVRRCYYGFPIALSYPHFLDVSPTVFDKVEGLHPDQAKHSSQFIINEESGLPLKVSVKMQINMAFGDLSKMAIVTPFSNMVLPMLWIELLMPGLPSFISWRYYFYLTIGPIVQALSTYLLLVGGVAFILLALASAALIPRLSVVSSNRGNKQQKTSEPPVLDPSKKRGPGGSIPTLDNKEMELYYCSLLSVQDPES